jgi:hypothetical protein
MTNREQSFNADEVPSPANGKRMSFTFWIYINDLVKYQGLYKNVFFRGDSTDDYSLASPAVLLNSNTNKLHIIFGTNQRDPYNGQRVNLGSKDNLIGYLIATRGITVDYIPLQRWVHVAVVVNEDVNGGNVSTYVNGELVNMVRSNVKGTVMVKSDSNKVSTQLYLQNMNLDKKGNVYVGGSTDGENTGFSGLVSRITFYNYDLNIKDVAESYMEGPVDGLASKIGAAYGVQTPVYRIG